MGLVDEIKNCIQCNELSSKRNNVVIGDGPVPCPLVILGEAPGINEDRKGKAFCGVAGAILDVATFQCNLKRGEDFHVLNVLKCRPPDNRSPTSKELSNCRPYLNRQLKAVKPRVVLALGKFAQAFILNEKPEKVTTLKNVGRVIEGKDFISVLTYHPSFINRIGNYEVTKAFNSHINKAVALTKRSL